MTTTYREGSPATSFAPLARTWRGVFTVVAALSTLGFVAAVGLWTAAVTMSRERAGGALFDAGFVAILVVILLTYLQAFIGMAWLHRAYRWLPWDQRYSRHWRGWISPGQAAALLLVPYFQYYWMFVVNTGLCDAFDRLRVRYPTREAAPKSLAIVACVMQIAIPIPVGAVCWVIFMSKIEAMSREMSAAAAARGHLAF